MEYSAAHIQPKSLSMTPEDRELIVVVEERTEHCLAGTLGIWQTQTKRLERLQHKTADGHGREPVFDVSTRQSRTEVAFREPSADQSGNLRLLMVRLKRTISLHRESRREFDVVWPRHSLNASFA